MPIKLWWWVEPLFYTGILTMIILGITVVLVDRVFPTSIASTILAAIAVLPWVVSTLSIVVWLVTNILILIWRH